MRKHKKPKMDNQTNTNFTTPIPPNNQILQIDDDGIDNLIYESETEHLLSLIEGATEKNPVILEYDDDDDVEITKIMFKGQCSNSKVEINEIDDDDVGCYPVLFVCGICSDSLPEHYKFGIKGCDHFYCSVCIEQYVGSKIDENVTQIGCPHPGCNGRLEIEGCRGILTKKVFERWGDRLCEGVILGLQKFYCPFKDCSGLLIDDGGVGVIRECKCPYCNRLFCAQCKVKWHGDIDCASFQELRGDEREREDILLLNLVKAESWRRCPSCRFYVERTNGCLFMHCRCGYNFCYSCGGHLVDHYCQVCKR